MRKISLVLWILPLISIASNDEFDTTAMSVSDQTFTTHSTSERPASGGDDNDFKLGIGGKVFVSPFDRVRSLILRHLYKLEKKSFIGLIIIPYIVCFFAAKGFWPFYPSVLQYQVSEMGKKIFSLSDDRIRQFCRGKFNFPDTCFRPDIWQSPTDCAFTLGTIQPSQPTWVDNGARLVKNNGKKTSAQKQTVFDVYTSTARPRVTSPANHLESLDNDKPSAINIQIHNVFSFQNDKPKNSSASMSPISQEYDNRFQIPYPLNQSNVFFTGDELN